MLFEKLKEWLGVAPAVDFAELVKGGAPIIDVRSKAEFAGGHIRGSVNIPLQELTANLRKLPDPELPIVVCCASGMRSASARSMLIAKGYRRVYNGGGWRSLANRI